MAQAQPAQPAWLKNREASPACNNTDIHSFTIFLHTRNISVAVFVRRMSRKRKTHKLSLFPMTSNAFTKSCLFHRNLDYHLSHSTHNSFHAFGPCDVIIGQIICCKVSRIKKKRLNKANIVLPAGQMLLT